MAAILNAEGWTIIGTARQIAALLGLLRGAAVVNLDRANLVILDKPIDQSGLARAIEALPRKVQT